jgi:hypothetical protein
MYRGSASFVVILDIAHGPGVHWSLCYLRHRVKNYSQKKAPLRALVRVPSIKQDQRCEDRLQTALARQ